MSAPKAVEEKPSFPEGYTKGEVWATPDGGSGGTFGATNAPTAGARTEKELQRGKHPLQLYSLGTPNGAKVQILLQELKIPYDSFHVNIMTGDQFTSGFVAGNPNSKIPTAIDYTHEKPIRLFESANIMKYVAEQYQGGNNFIPADLGARTEMYNWLFWLQGSAPYIGGGFGHFFAYAPISIKYAIDRFSMEVSRLLDVCEKHLSSTGEAGEFVYFAGKEYTLADMVIFPWVYCLANGYKDAGKFLSFEKYQNVIAWMDRIAARPAVQRGSVMQGFDKKVTTFSTAKDGVGDDAEIEAAVVAGAAAWKEKYDTAMAVFRKK